MLVNNFIMGVMDDNFKADNGITYETRQKLDTIVNNIMYFLELGSDNEFSLFYTIHPYSLSKLLRRILRREEELSSVTKTPE